MYMYMYMYVCTHTHTHIYRYIYIYIHTYLFIHACHFVLVKDSECLSDLGCVLMRGRDCLQQMANIHTSEALP